LYSYSAISNDPELVFAKKLTEQAKVATIPVSAFYQKEKNNHVLRFCFAKQESTLEEAVNRLIAFQNN
jgi:methionine aminotransferase